mmetsp:Transcript_78057/g.173007  ORF Transcript_78057/g.173007 Transcript_78057/m.173007 type:complete len:251 (-) Transcript_78057:242-994(-)
MVGPVMRALLLHFGSATAEDTALELEHHPLPTVDGVVVEADEYAVQGELVEQVEDRQGEQEPPRSILDQSFADWEARSNASESMSMDLEDGFELPPPALDFEEGLMGQPSWDTSLFAFSTDAGEGDALHGAEEGLERGFSTPSTLCPSTTEGTDVIIPASTPSTTAPLLEELFSQATAGEEAPYDCYDDGIMDTMNMEEKLRAFMLEHIAAPPRCPRRRMAVRVGGRRVAARSRQLAPAPRWRCPPCPVR